MTLQTPDNSAGQILGRLKQDILDGVYQPGEKLLMARLKARYGVGVSPLREALSQLLVEQLVVVENQRGFKVSPISMQELEDIYDARAHIEALCVRLAVERGDDDWEAGIVASAHRLFKYSDGEHVEGIDVREWQRLHMAFHTAITAGCGSEQLMTVRQSLYEKAARYRSLWLQENVSHSASLHANQQEHQELMELVLARNAGKATALIQQHLMVPVTVIKNCLTQKLTA